MEKRDSELLEDIIENCSKNMNHLEKILIDFNGEYKLKNTESYIKLQIYYFQKSIIYNKSLFKVAVASSDDRKEYISFMKTTLKQIMDCLDELLSDKYNESNVEYEYQNSVCKLLFQKKYFETYKHFFDEEIEKLI
jgi:hypothetical protein